MQTLFLDSCTSIIYLYLYCVHKPVLQLFRLIYPTQAWRTSSVYYCVLSSPLNLPLPLPPQGFSCWLRGLRISKTSQLASAAADRVESCHVACVCAVRICRGRVISTLGTYLQAYFFSDTTLCRAVAPGALVIAAAPATPRGPSGSNASIRRHSLPVSWRSLAPFCPILSSQGPPDSSGRRA